MSDLDAEQTDIRPLLALIEREGGYMTVDRVYTDLREAKLVVIGANAAGWISSGDTPTLAVARLVKAVAEGDQAALMAATGGGEEAGR